MPSINLRLTDEQLAELRAWAEDSERSLQREIVYRLFARGIPSTKELSPLTEAPTERWPVPPAMDSRPLPWPEAGTNVPARRKRTEMCEHRVAAGSFCKRCDT